MKVFADTNFFTNLWLDLPFTEEAAALLGRLREERGFLPITRLLRMEFTNALQRLVYETRHGSQSLRATPETVLVARALFAEELDAEDLLRWQSVPEERLEQTFEDLCYRYTPEEGFRTYDVLHVATALLLNCDSFWTFDIKARKLAKLVGLQTN